MEGPFSRIFADAVATLIAAPVSARLTDVRRIRSNKYFASVADPMGCYLLDCCNPAGDPDGVQEICLLEFAPPIASLLADRLAGKGGGHLNDRSLRRSDRPLLKQLADLAAESLSRAWPVTPRPRFTTANGSSYRRLRGLGSPERLYSVHTFDLHLAETHGPMRVCLPPKLLIQPTG